MGFPAVIVECAFSSILSETSSAQSGFTEITDYVEAISGTLRGRSYELDSVETGTITLALDNADGRFTPGSALSPYFPHVKANRRLRIRGKNLQQLNIARAGGQEHTAAGFFRDAGHVLDASDGVTMRVAAPVLASHNPVTLGFTGDLMAEQSHVEATVSTGAAAGTYRVLSWWAPVELGVRETHSAYVWLVSGTEPTGTKIRLINTYYDEGGNEISAVTGADQVEWSRPTSATPVRRVFADLPPGDAAYCIQSLAITTTGVLTTPLTYAVCGIQSEIPTGNLVPSISGYFDAAAWNMNGSGTIATGGTDASTAYVLGTWAADDTELVTVVPHLQPGVSYTFTAQIRKSAGPDLLLTGDDGLTGVTLSTNTTWTTLLTTFTAKRPEQPVKIIPQGAVSVGATVWVRLARLAVSNAALPLAVTAADTDETGWARPIPVFDGWVEQWPIKTTAAASTISITVNDRLKNVGEVVMDSTLNQTVSTDSPMLLIPFTDDPIDSKGSVSIFGGWADDANTSQLAPAQTKYGAGPATFTLGALIGPTGEDAAKLTPAATAQGWVFAVPFSADYYIPAPPAPPAPKPVPNSPVLTTYKKKYYATWSRSFDGTNATRYDDPATLYQGAALESGDTNGNQRSLIGFNWNAINSDLKGASVVGATVTLYALHWWYYAGGTGYLGTHTYTSKPSTYSSGSAVERRWKQTGWPRNAWRTVNIGASGGVLFQKGTAKGIVVGWGDNDHQSYGYFAGATMSQRPFITITYKK
jgi:hypothetical protein